MNKTMSDCCAFWALYICLNENGQYKKEEEAQNWLAWMEELAEKEDESQRTEQEPVKIVQYHCTCGKTMKFESEHGVIAPQRTWVGLTDEERIDILVDAMRNKWDDREIIKAIAAKLKEKNSA